MFELLTFKQHRTDLIYLYIQHLLQEKNTTNKLLFNPDK